MPEFNERDYVKVADILHTTECELKDAIDVLSATYSGARNQLVSATYQLKLVETGSGSGDTALVVPVHNGVFTIGFAAGVTTKTTRDTSTTVTYETENLECLSEDQSLKRLEGGLGLKEWLVQNSNVLARARETPTAMSYKVRFDVSANGSVSPKLGIKRANGHQIGGSIGLSGKREKLHSISVSVAAIKPLGTVGGGKKSAQRRLDQEVQQFLLRDISIN